MPAAGLPLLLGISIHAPREGSDHVPLRVAAHAVISIHAPREGSDCVLWVPADQVEAFQSTLPVRGATAGQVLVSVALVFQSTLPVRGAT